MKRVILFAVLSLFFVGGNAQTDYPIYQKFQTTSDISALNLSPKSYSIPCSFGASDFDFPTINFENKKVVKVYYCYSANTDNPEFGQNSLSNERYEKLIAQYPSLKNAEIEWVTYAQTGCAGMDCVEDLFHGFIIEYAHTGNTKETLSQPTIKPKKEESFKLDRTNLPIQNSKINVNHQNMVKGVNGTRIIIPAHAFCYADGSIVSGQVDFQLVEAITLEDIVIGNMCTLTDKGELLESRGMVELRAYQGNQELQLREDKNLYVEIPTQFEERFNNYEGEIDEKGNVQWTDPQKFDPSEFDKLFMETEQVESFDAMNDNPNMVNVFKDVNGVLVAVHLPVEGENVEFNAMNYSEKVGREYGLTSKESKVIAHWFAQNKVDIYSLYTCRLRKTIFGNVKMRRKPSKVGFIKEHLINVNRFAVNRMGWRNIDCLAHMKNSEKMKLEIKDITAVLAATLVQFSLVIPSIKSMVPGFRKANGNYSFTHGDYEEYAPYPKGETAYVVGTGIKDGKEYSVMQKIIFGENEVEEVELIERSKEETLRLLKDTF